MATIELSLAPEHARRLFRHREVSRLRRGRGRSAPVSTTWHEFDGPPDLVLSEAHGIWRLERPMRSFGLAAECETVAESASPALLGAVERPVPRVALSGQRRMVTLADGDDEPVRLTLVKGVLRDVAREWPCCRLTIEGDGRRAALLALSLGETLTVSMPVVSLGEEALLASRGVGPAIPASASVDADATVDEAIRTVVGHLAGALLTLAPTASLGETPEAVHQMRVALRRLRSAMLVFKGPLGGSLDELRGPLAALGRVLGSARDWDVFLKGTGAEVCRAMGGETRIVSLMEDASRSREAAYETLRGHLASAATRRLLLHLALLPSLAPWWPADLGEADQALLVMPVREFAPRTLERRFKRMLAADDLMSLPASALHETRKSGKKLRYALEFFSPVLPRREVRKLARRLSRAQDELGAINDTETGASLLAGLTRGGRHEFASGAVLGWLAARAEAARVPLEETWAGLRRQERFWRHRRLAGS